MAYRDYSTSNGFIVDVNGLGDFTSLAAACAVATPGTTIFLKTSVTENITIPAGVVIRGPAATQYNATSPAIIGKITMSAAGSSTLSSIRVVTNGDYCIHVTGANASQLGFESCVITADNNTAILYDNSNSGSAITIDNCNTQINTTGITLFTSSSAGILTMSSVRCENTGASTTFSTSSVSSVILNYCLISFPIATSGTGNANFLWCEFSPTATNVTMLQVAGTPAHNIQFSNMVSGTQPTITIANGSTVNATYVSIGSSNASVIQGHGTLNKAYLVFTSSGSALAGTLTINTYTTA